MSIFSHVGAVSLTNCWRYVSLQVFISHFSIWLSLFKVSHPRLPIHADRQKGCLSSYSRGFHTTIFHYSSSSVSLGCFCVKRQIFCNNIYTDDAGKIEHICLHTFNRFQVRLSTAYNFICTQFTVKCSYVAVTIQFIIRQIISHNETVK